MARSPIVTASLVALVALVALTPAAAASPTPVLVDQRWDVSWHWAGVHPAIDPLTPARDLVVERNGSAVDLLAIRVLENTTHVTVEMDIAEAPPRADACARPQGDPDLPPRCTYAYVVNWSFYHPAAVWGPGVSVQWHLECQPACEERAFVRLGDGPDWTAESDLVDFAWTDAPSGVWSIDKRVFQRGLDAGMDPVPDARLCRGDVFAEFLYYGDATEEFGVNGYYDRAGLRPFWLPPEGHEPQHHLIEHDSPACPTAQTDGGTTALAPASHGEDSRSERPGSGPTIPAVLPGGTAWMAVVSLMLVVAAAGVLRVRGPRR